MMSIIIIITIETNVCQFIKVPGDVSPSFFTTQVRTSLNHKNHHFCDKYIFFILIVKYISMFFFFFLWGRGGEGGLFSKQNTHKKYE